VEPLAERWVKLRIHEEGGHVCISVTDSGNGVPGELAPKLFQPFFTTKPVGKGMGLGLSISRGILTAHGGTLSAGLDGGHTCFMARLPKGQ
jgi:C4-dicarboxylate-specific signal transduction histidine kinase